ncbi:restriction endonuclease subunit S domain-containing protein [Frateuria aurantia]
MEAQQGARNRLDALARIWQPSRLKGIQVSREYGSPFLAATQVFDVRPTPRKYLALEKTRDSDQLFVESGQILVTRSGTVGRSILAYKGHEGVVISDDLLRVNPLEPELSGWVYGYLRSDQARAMMTSAQYGHVIKHLEPAHLGSLPVPLPSTRLAAEFNSLYAQIVASRDEAWSAQLEAESMLSSAVGNIKSTVTESGFSVSARDLFGGRRRLEASFHSPAATSILSHYKKRGLRCDSLADLCEGVWWLTRFKRVFGEGGDPYLSADELFSLNTTGLKRVLVEQADNPDAYRVRAGWIVMACSGQTYGLNGSVAFMTTEHEQAFFSHDLVRIIPNVELVDAGYLFTALGHPSLGRPLVIRNAYGTSIPHLDPADVAAIPIVRLGKEREAEIGAKMAHSIMMRATASELERQIAEKATHELNLFLAGSPLA